MCQLWFWDFFKDTATKKRPFLSHKPFIDSEVMCHRSHEDDFQSDIYHFKPPCLVFFSLFLQASHWFSLALDEFPSYLFLNSARVGVLSWDFFRLINWRLGKVWLISKSVERLAFSHPHIPQKIGSANLAEMLWSMCYWVATDDGNSMSTLHCDISSETPVPILPNGFLVQQ